MAVTMHRISIPAEQINGTEEKSVTVKRPTGEVRMRALELGRPGA